MGKGGLELDFRQKFRDLPLCLPLTPNPTIPSLFTSLFVAKNGREKSWHKNGEREEDGNSVLSKKRARVERMVAGILIGKTTNCEPVNT